jgi:hypothetical protein
MLLNPPLHPPQLLEKTLGLCTPQRPKRWHMVAHGGTLRSRGKGREGRRFIFSFGK